MITAVLITWRRQHNIPRIIRSLLKVSQINEILIHDNSKGRNKACYRRFELALKARNNLIYTQDDDCINHDIELLIKNHKTITCGATGGYMNALTKYPYTDTNLALLGYGSLFNKKDIDFSKYLLKHPKDLLFYREADRIFTLLGNKPTVVGCDIELLDEELHAMSSDDSHLDDRKEIISRCQKLV